MSTISVLIPDDTFAVVRRAPEEIAREMRIAVAVRWYDLGLVSLAVRPGSVESAAKRLEPRTSYDMP